MTATNAVPGIVDREDLMVALRACVDRAAETVPHGRVDHVARHAQLDGARRLRWAMAAASPRVVAPTLRRMFDTWTLAVFVLM
jgi:hypothetical protein